MANDETIAALERLRRSAETAHLAPSHQLAVGIHPHEARAILALIERERNGGDRNGGERAQIVAALSDPAAVHAGMLRGEIAKLSVEAWAHTHCLTNREGWQDMTLAEAGAHLKGEGDG